MNKLSNDPIVHIDLPNWATVPDRAQATQWVNALKQGMVLFFMLLSFDLIPGELELLDPSLSDPKRKNISYNPATGQVSGTVASVDQQRAMATMLKRYHEHTLRLVENLLPHYQGRLRIANTSLRLGNVAERKMSWRKDDTRLHVDAFPSRPNYGERILRVFNNINPHGVPRVWRVGEPFTDMAKRFLPNIDRPLPGSAWLMQQLHLTKSLRSEYDHIMLKLHDAMKADLHYQAHSPQIQFEFPPGSTWMCFSDQASHAAMSGQFMLEQTFHIAVADMRQPETAPLSILQKLTGRELV